MRWLALSLAMLMVSLSAHARVFSYKESVLAAYLRGSGGLSAVGQKPFGDSSGIDTSIDDSTKFNYSGELGAQFGFSENVRLRLGVELLQHRPVKEAKGLDATGAERFSLDSSVFILHPVATLEYTYSVKGGIRFFSALGVGYADVTVENRYAMTAQGESALGVGSFNEKMSATTTSAQVAIGMETLFVDNVTFALDLGYRYMPVKSLKYKSNVNNIVSPSGAQKGAEALSHDGTQRSMDLGGVFIGAAFRFHLK